MYDTIALTYAVPAEVAVAFQSPARKLLAKLLADRPESVTSGGFAPLPNSEARARENWQQPPLTDRDHDRIEWAVGDTPTGLQVLAFLIDNAGRTSRGQQIAAECGLKGAKSVPPTFQSLATRCRRTGRRPMWDYDQQQGYTMRIEVAGMLAPYVETQLAS